MQSIDTLIWATSAIYPADPKSVDQWPDYELEALECAIYYCVKNIKASVQGNRILEERNEVTTAFRDPDSWKRGRERDPKANFEPYRPQLTASEINSLEFHPLNFAADYSNLAIIVPQEDGSRKSYEISYEAVMSLSAHIQGLFQGLLAEYDTQNTTPPLRYNGQVWCNGNVAIPRPLILDEMFPFGGGRMADTFLALATSITNEMRRAFQGGGRQAFNERFLGSETSVAGLVGRLHVTYDVRWE